jgi:hypothetical protein
VKVVSVELLSIAAHARENELHHLIGVAEVEGDEAEVAALRSGEQYDLFGEVAFPVVVEIVAP